MLLTRERRTQLVAELVQARHGGDVLTERSLLHALECEVGAEARHYAEVLLDASDKLEAADEQATVTV